MKQDKPAGISEKVIRLLDIYTLIARNKFPSIDSLMERFCVSKRTVYRYLELINIIDPIEYSREKNGYRFTGENRIKKSILTDEEFQILLTAYESLSRLGLPFRERFLRLVTQTFTRFDLDKKNKPIFVKAPDPIINERIESILKTLTSCIQEKKAVDITYRARGSKDITHRTVEPYNIVLYEGIWILIGYCHLRKTIRSFALDRIIDIKEGRYHFHIPDFDIKAYLEAPWGIVEGKRTKITVRFKKEISDYILRKDRWHPSEKRTILPDGDVELTFTVAGAFEIKKWIYSWLPHVEVIKPKWLRKRIKEELSTSFLNHS